ncbi:MAG: hypothetical protein WDN46_10620 [Methylocella sp.]
MSLQLEGAIIHLIGECRVEDAEALLALLRADGARALDMKECTWLHTAVLQVVLAFRPAIAAPCEESFMAKWIFPAFADL